MGLRVYRYTLRMTNEDAKLALTGFTMVLARGNATIPAMLMPWPTDTKTTAQSQPKKGICLSNQHGLLGEDACHRALR